MQSSSPRCRWRFPLCKEVHWLSNDPKAVQSLHEFSLNLFDVTRPASTICLINTQYSCKYELIRNGAASQLPLPTWCSEDGVPWCIGLLHICALHAPLPVCECLCGEGTIRVLSPINDCCSRKTQYHPRRLHLPKRVFALQLTGQSWKRPSRTECPAIHCKC